MDAFHSNPFLRGYQQLSINRLLLITFEDDFPPVYRPLHRSQAHLYDHEVQCFPCIFCDEFALITEGHHIRDNLQDQCATDGIVRQVVYEIVGTDLESRPVRIGDAHSLHDAETVVRRLSFDTGHYSRAWEINTAHLPEADLQFLQQLASNFTPCGLMFEIFAVPGTGGIGCKLIGTPWTDQNLDLIGKPSIEAFREELFEAGVSETLFRVLHLAALADVRVLIFDPLAKVLEGLPVFDETSTVAA
ncbi:ABC transporter substrate-binding protein [Azotobacter vinelandii]|uniref:DUF5983 family protein n=1 Tax=Azotobacter vinelandii TaxID=354 RepID=UPI000914232A|nr:ABC transporter substrate-binding protein [Azotobacter vinelandii]WKN23179.1 ABC transporter substrate-binding protein [Azotobacter vinelandii]SFY09238.1 hypothetical protein SAMN04244547_03955 [Azotobacter vinelandii]